MRERSKGLMVIVLFLGTFFVNAYYPPYGGRVLGTYLGFSEYKGYSFSVSDELRTKILSFGSIKDSTLLTRFDLKGGSLVGDQFVITYSSGVHEDTGGVQLTLISLKKANSHFNFDKFVEKKRKKNEN